MPVCALLAWNLPMTMVFDDRQEGTVLCTCFACVAWQMLDVRPSAAWLCASHFKFGSIDILLVRL